MHIFRGSLVALGVTIGLVIASSSMAGAEAGWAVDVSAHSACVAGSVVVQVSFANHGTKPTYASAVDRDSSVYANLGEIGAGRTATAVLTLGKPSTPQGLVFFDTELADGSDATSREAVYEPIDCATPSSVVATTAKTAKVATPAPAPAPTTQVSLTPTVIEPQGDARALASCYLATGQYHLRVELANSGFVDWTVASSPELPQLIGTPIRQGTAEAQVLDLPGTTKLASFGITVRASNGRKLTVNGAITPAMDGSCATGAAATTVAPSTVAPSTTVAPITTVRPAESVNTKTEPTSAKAKPGVSVVQWLALIVLVILIAGMSWLNSRQRRDQDGSA